MPLALLALTIGAFAIGTTEFVIVGLIPTVAADLGVSLPSAGLLVSLYALGVAIGAPLLTALTARVPRKTLLLGLMALFALGNLLAWLAPGYTALVVARVVTGLAHGVFFSIGSTIATSLVARDKAASAIAVMFSGLTVALVTGVPLGTFIGQHFGWRATFLAVSALGVISFVASLVFVPRNLPLSAPTTVLQQLQVLRKPRLLLVYAMTAVGYGGSFIAFTFLAPMLQQVTGFAPDTVGLVLLVYGISVAVGNIAGGRMADRLGPTRALHYVFFALAVVLALFSAAASSPLAALIVVLLWGAVAFGNVPGLQVYVVQQAARHSPQAMDVASGLNIAAFNIGIAFGAWAGGLIVAQIGLVHTGWIGGLVVLVALALTHYSAVLDRRDPLPSNVDTRVLAACH